MINKDGAYIGPMDFTFEPETEVFHSCSLTYLDEVFIFGGSLQPKQISVSCPEAFVSASTTSIVKPNFILFV